MRIQSNLKPRDYTENEVCRIINPKQRDLYIKHRVFTIDMYPSFRYSCGINYYSGCYQLRVSKRGLNILGEQGLWSIKNNIF